jgi:hypothetical protein
MPISGWTSRACAKHQIMHDMMNIPKLIAKDGNRQPAEHTTMSFDLLL